MQKEITREKELLQKITRLSKEKQKLEKLLVQKNLSIKKLEQDSFQLNLLFEASTDAIYFKDAESRFTKVNPTMVRNAGLKSPKELIGLTDFDCFLEEHAQNAFNDELHIIKTGTPVIGKVEKETWPDGRITWVTSSKMPIVLADNKIAGIIGISRDITDLQEAEHKLKASEERFRSLIKHLSDMIIILDRDLNIKYASESSKKMMGMESKDLISKNASELIHPDDIEKMRIDFFNVLHKENDYLPTQMRCRHQERGWIYLDIIANNLEGFPGIEGVVITARDITERKKAELEVEKTLLELERSNKELEQFAYAVSHDLQEPLRKVKSFSELLYSRYKDSLDEKAGTYIEYLVDGSRRMQGLIQDLLSYSRINSKGSPFTRINSENVLQDAMSNLTIAIQESNARFEIGELPELMADSGQILRLFQNLISNAIKFRSSKDPLIVIKANKMKRHWRFTVSDNGIGIDLKHSDRIFQVFQRLHSRSDYEGTGIGLALCKRIVERHGGEILVESAIGEGTTFIFTIFSGHKKN